MYPTLETGDQIDVGITITLDIIRAGIGRRLAVVTRHIALIDEMPHDPDLEHITRVALEAQADAYRVALAVVDEAHR